MGLIIYFHGLESPSGGPKYKFLKERYGDVYAPKMEYSKYKNTLFNDIYEQIKNKKIDIISGSSMGGFFAYYMAKKLGSNTILFNPGLHSRTFTPSVDISGTKVPFHDVILGEKDDVILPDKTIVWLQENEKKGNYKIHWGKNGHRTPYQLFKSTFKKFG